MPEYLPDGTRKVWNPLARYYVEPPGEWIAEKLKGTFITPNMVSIFNTIIGILAGFLLLGNYFHLILFGIWVRFYHMFDIVDGHLARISNKKSTYGGFIDAIGDRLVMGIWPAFMIYRLFTSSGNLLYLLYQNNHFHSE